MTVIIIAFVERVASVSVLAGSGPARLAAERAMIAIVIVTVRAVHAVCVSVLAIFGLVQFVTAVVLIHVRFAVMVLLT